MNENALHAPEPACEGDTDDLVKLSFFVEIAKAIAQCKTIDQTLNEIMAQIGKIFAPLNWSILLKNPDTSELTFSLVVGQSSETLRGLRLQPGQGLAGWIAETGKPVIVEDVSRDSRFSPRVDEFTGFTTKSIIGVPLMSGDRVFGVIELINKLDGAPFTSFELKVLTTIADFAAIAIEKAYYLKALKRMATVDSLTGAYNRGAFDEAYTREIDMCTRYDMPLSLLMLDIDNFKSINDTHGHLTGDRVLRTLVGLVADCIRKVDMVFRYGGDEFVVIMPNTSKDQAQVVRSRILDRIERQNGLDPAVPFHVSIGLQSARPGECGDLLGLLDVDLYREKGKKFNRSVENLDEHLEELLNEERSKLRHKGQDRKH